MMRKIGIVGAGQAGLILGIALVDAGYEVTIFSARTSEEIFNGKLNAPPILFPDAIEIEAHLGLNFWDKESLVCQRYHSQVCDTSGNVLSEVSHTLEKPWQALDQRLKFPKWMKEFVARGGKLITLQVNQTDLDELSSNYDLVVIAVGKATLSTLFERDKQKSLHNSPKRHIGTSLVKGKSKISETFEITVIPNVGEIIQSPFYNKEQNLCYILGFQAYPQGEMDRFYEVQNGAQFLERAKEIIEKFKPNAAFIFENLELISDNSWLCGAVTPIVRKPVAQLESGRIVMAIGDAIIAHDPCGAQGANNATKMSHQVAQRIIAHGSSEFDRQWMEGVFEEFWQYAQYSVALTNSLLSPTAHLQDISRAMARNPEIVNDYINGFNHPPSLAPWFFDPQETQKYLAQKNSQNLTNVV